MRSSGTDEFWRRYHALRPESKSAARLAYKKFADNPAHPSLHLERLRGDTRFWSVRVTRDYRAVARRFKGDFWLWVWIGPHKEFDRTFGA